MYVTCVYRPRRTWEYKLRRRGASTPRTPRSTYTARRGCRSSSAGVWVLPAGLFVIVLLHCCLIESHSTVLFLYLFLHDILLINPVAVGTAMAFFAFEMSINPRILRACMRPTNASFSPPWRNPSSNTRYMFKRACVYTWLESQKYLTLAYIQ